MKILYFANLRLPTEKAHGVQIMRTCHALADAQNREPEGSAVILVTPFRWRATSLRSVKDVYAYYGVEKNFRIVTLPSLDFSPLVKILPFLDRLVFAIQYGSFLLSCSLFLAISYKLKAMNFVVYTRDSRIARIALRFTKMVFFELHTIPKNNDIEIARAVSGAVTVTKKLKELLLAEGAQENKVAVIPDAVNYSAFASVFKSPQELRKELRLPLDAMLVGYVGRLKTMGEEKGIPELLEAFAIVYKKRRDMRLVIVGGDTSDITRFTAYLRDHGLASRVHFVPHVAPSETPKYLKSFDVVVAPFPNSEHYAYAMSPLKVFEYMASGKPMVVSDLPSIREILPEDAAFFFEPGNAEDLAHALNNTLENNTEAHFRAEKAEKLATVHTWHNRAMGILSFVDERLKNL